MVKLTEKNPAPQVREKSFEENYAKLAAGMTPAQMMDAYRTLPSDDPFRDYIKEQIVKSVAPPEMSKTQSAIAGATDMMSLGMSDEINGLISKLAGGNYEGEVGAQRQMQRTAREDNPWSYAGGQLAGAIPGAAASAMTLPAAATLRGAAALAAAEGATQGGIYGAASGENPADRLWQAIEQGAIGGTIGAASPFAGKVLGTAWRYGKDAIKNSKSTQKAAQSVWQMLQDNNLTLNQARALLSKYGKMGTLGDISPGMQVEAAGTSAASTGASSVMSPRYKARAEGMPGRVKGYMDEAFGPFKDPQTITDSVKATQKSTGPAYRLAEQHIVDAEGAVEAIRRLQKTYGPKSDTGQALQKYLDQLVDGKGNIIGQGNIVHGVRQEIDAALRRGNLPNSGPFKEVRDQLDEVLKGQIPGFADADKTWSGAQKVQEAFDYGQQKLLTENVYPGQNAKAWNKMSDLEKEATLMGTRAKLEMSTVSGAPNPGLRLERTLEKNMNDQKVGPMIEARKPGAYPKLKNALDTETTMRETNDLVQATRGSRTAPVNQAAERRWGVKPTTANLPQAGADAATAFAIGGPGAAVVSLGARGLGAGVKGILGKLVEQNPEIVRYAGDLLSRQGPEARNALREVIAVLRARGLSQAEAEKIAGVAQRAVKGSAAYLSGANREPSRSAP